MESSSLLHWSRIIIDVGGRDSYSSASQFFAHLALISFALRLMTIRYEISRLILQRKNLMLQKFSFMSGANFVNVRHHPKFMVHLF
ncbi:MAG: hypothetical protein K9M81_05995 [Chthoniobacterales bacterium]|nr:hypothetical protein [Chthoniobacterales bacterium]